MKRPLYEKCKLLKTVLFQTLKSSFIVTLKLLFDFESYLKKKKAFLKLLLKYNCVTFARLVSHVLFHVIYKLLIFYRF